MPGPHGDRSSAPVHQLGRDQSSFPVETTTVACDGGDGPLGHPRVYLTLSRDGEIECPYCSRKYVLKEGATAAAH